LARAKAYRAANLEKVNGYGAEYRARYRDELNAKRKEYRLEHLDAARAYARQYFAAASGKYCVYKAMAKSKRRAFELSVERFAELVSAACEYCGDKGGGIDRVDNSIGYVDGNVVPCCQMCNLAKKDYSVDEFREWIDRVHAHQHRPLLALVRNVGVDSPK
jgi:hypothetical protein